MRRQLYITIRFFQEYWPEVVAAAKFTVALWGAILGLSVRLARKLSQEEMP